MLTAPFCKLVDHSGDDLALHLRPGVRAHDGLPFFCEEDRILALVGLALELSSDSSSDAFCLV